MPGGRPPGPRPSKEYTGEEIAVARLQGESTGRMLGRISERTAIVNWLKWQSGTPEKLAIRISKGEHCRSPRDE